MREGATHGEVAKQASSLTWAQHRHPRTMPPQTRPICSDKGMTTTPHAPRHARHSRRTVTRRARMTMERMSTENCPASWQEEEEEEEEEVGHAQQHHHQVHTSRMQWW